MATDKVLSCDSHVVEPGDLWLKYIDPAFRERAPKLVRGEKTDTFSCEGVQLFPIGLSCAAGRKKEEVRGDVGHFEEVIRPGCYDPAARLKDMEIDGLMGEVLYPTVALLMFAIPDVPYQQACFRAYNRWMADFCSVYPKVFKGMGLISIDEIEQAIEELHFIRKAGLVGGVISVDPFDEKRYSAPEYAPFWATAQELDLSISLHVGTGRKRIGQPDKPHIGNLVISSKAAPVIRTLADMVFFGVFERYPKLKVVSAENDCGWVPYVLERMDFLFYEQRAWREMSIGNNTSPSQYFKRNVWVTFIRDRVGVKNRDLIGVDRIMWSSDYPHQQCTWPTSKQVIAEHMVGVSQADERKMVYENAARLYGYLS